MKLIPSCPTAKQWDKVGLRPHHGIQVALFALHSKNSCGIGEFLDLIPLIDWCTQAYLDFIQLLPLSHAESDPSPYNSESSCAFNLLYLSLWALPGVQEKQLRALQQLNTSQRVLYEKVTEGKLCFLREYYEQYGAELLKETGYTDFIKANNWVQPYALFKTLKQQFNSIPWREWPNHTPRESLYPTYEKEMNFYSVMQYLCFKQMREVKQHAESKKILLMGDLPILLAQESADNWQHPTFFNPHLGAGAPPDQYTQEGQNWGLPLFNWDAMRKDQFSWWRQRLQVAQQYFDLFRIDHILGFFRLFAIPFHHPAKEGSYIPDNDTDALKQGQELLEKILSLTQMLPIGEDLGTTPPYVRPCLKTLGICGTKVIRWERRWQADKSYIPVEEYEPLSLTCVSTHDSEPLSLWWKDCEEEAKLFAKSKGWTYEKELHKEQREEILKESHRSTSLFHANLLQEYLAYFPELIHSSPEEERINIPGTQSPTNWTYRYKLPLEQMVCHEGLLGLMRACTERGDLGSSRDGPLHP